jgi:hypothetical protein
LLLTYQESLAKQPRLQQSAVVVLFRNSQRLTLTALSLVARITINNSHSAIETLDVRQEAQQLEQTHASQCLLSLEDTTHIRPSFSYYRQGNISSLFCNIQLACASCLVVEAEGIEAGDASSDNRDCPALILLLPA